MEGLWIEWKGEHKKSEIHYEGGQRHGPATTWHRTGQLREPGRYE